MLNHNFLQSPSYASFHQFLLGRIISEKEILSQEPKIPFCRLNTSAQLPYSVRRPVRNGFVLNNRNTIDMNCVNRDNIISIIVSSKGFNPIEIIIILLSLFSTLTLLKQTMWALYVYLLTLLINVMDFKCLLISKW